jgi:serine/threonine-protein kinase
MTGRTLDRYRIEEQLGSGGMAVVYRGVDETLERAVAVKVLHPHLASRSEHRRRLAREAKAVARLHHPNILEIYDFSGEDSEEAYLVTELIRGRTLKAFALAHAFDPPELAAACVHELAGALAHAHAQGIVHRDLKPDNVMIREDVAAPALKLMDFGIAQILDRDERMTMTGSLIGSPAHMAPEIIDGEEADERSDLFSLGTILYSLATGQLPFDGPNPGALLKRILSGEYTDPRELRPAVSDELARIIAACLARDRDQRVPSAQALQARLAACLEEVDLGRPAELLARFLRTPATTAFETRAHLVRHLMKAGAEAAAQRRIAKALAAWSRVIALSPGTGDAGAAREAIDRLKSRRRWRRRLLGAGAAAGLASIGLAAWTHLPQPIESAPVSPERPPPAAPAAAPPERPPDATTTLPAPAPLPSAPESRPARPARAAEPDPEPARPRPAHLRISTKPWANVTIDGVPQGTTLPSFDRELPPGPHLVRLTHECCEPLELRPTLAPGASEEIRQALAPRPARLVLEVAPGDTQVTIDGQNYGYASEHAGRPLSLVMLPDERSGAPRYDRSVVVALTREGYADQRLELRLYAGQDAPLRATLLARE